MKVYVFGNRDQACDNRAPAVADQKIPGVEFVMVEPNADLPISSHECTVLMDTVAGLKQVALLTEIEIDKLIIPKSTTTHDFDLGFQLKLYKKLGWLKNIRIIGIPQEGKVDYSLLHSILRKLVEQDMQGS